jgi:hypothetical protein
MSFGGVRKGDETITFSLFGPGCTLAHAYACIWTLRGSIGGSSPKGEADLQYLA